jgi:hypothetical protein
MALYPGKLNSSTSFVRAIRSDKAGHVASIRWRKIACRIKPPKGTQNRLVLVFIFESQA